MTSINADKTVGTRTCTKCGATHPATAEFFYRHKACKYGLAPRCKPCVDADNRSAFVRRMAAEPEKVRAQAAARTRRRYRKDIEKSREYLRQHAARMRQDPEKRARINMRKRAGGAGMTPPEFEALFASQGNRCAICCASEPSSRKGTTSWNVDHCHKTDKVRFILCCHCNRGLGAFRDDPVLMRKAAKLLETIYDSQSAILAEGRSDSRNGLGKEIQ